MKRDSRQNKGGIAAILRYAVGLLVIALLCFAVWYLRVVSIYTPPIYQRVHSDNGVWDFTATDFENSFARPNGKVEYIPGALLTPGEFARRESEAQLGKADAAGAINDYIMLVQGKYRCPMKTTRLTAVITARQTAAITPPQAPAARKRAMTAIWPGGCWRWYWRQWHCALA